MSQEKFINVGNFLPSMFTIIARWTVFSPMFSHIMERFTTERINFYVSSCKMGKENKPKKKKKNTAKIGFMHFL